MKINQAKYFKLTIDPEVIKAFEAEMAKAVCSYCGGSGHYRFECLKESSDATDKFLRQAYENNLHHPTNRS